MAHDEKAGPHVDAPPEASHEHGRGAGHDHAHGGQHSHSHEDEHAHDHDQGESMHGSGHVHPHVPHGEVHEHPGARPVPLSEGAGAGKVLFLDAFSGLAGDMIIGALLDLGVPLLVVERAVGALPIEGFHLHRGHTHRSGIVATKFDVHLEAAQPERTYGAIDGMIAASALSPAIKALARKIFRRLGEAEAAVHRTPIDDVHFHEVGGVDAVVDIIGAAACFVYLGAEVVVSPLPMGRGFVRARHGILPLPAPATVWCLAGAPTYPVALDVELVTPTGAAITATVASRYERWPAFAPELTGWGSGTADLPDRPNLLRAVLGTHATTSERQSATHAVLEANVDDMTGEMAAHTIEALLRAGALDAWAAPVTMKKGRPGLIISVLAEASAADALGAVLLRESTSLGVRRTPVDRIERPRRIVAVDTPYGPIPVKVSDGGYGPPIVKPEFDACVMAAAAHGVPVRVVIAIALARAQAMTLSFSSKS